MLSWRSNPTQSWPFNVYIQPAYPNALHIRRLDWTAEQVAAGYGGQQSIERVFRGLKDGDWLGWGPMHHWTDRKIRIHAFYCMLGISLPG
jgi:transposase